MDNWAGRVAVVTGGGSGIGAGIVGALADAGMRVAVADIDLAAAEAVAERATAGPGEAFAVHTDVASLADVRSLHAQVTERWGSVHVLCNNAGVSLLRRGMHATHADWEWVLGVNLWGVVHGMETFLPGMLAAGEPAHIVNTASMNGLFPSGRSALYSASKYAVVGLTETFRDELARTNVGLSLLCPAAVTTRIDDSERNRPDHLTGPAPAEPFVPIASFELSPPRHPEEVGAMVLGAIREKQFYIFTDTAVRPYIETRHAAMLRDLERVPAPVPAPEDD